MKLEELIAREEIRDLTARWTDAVNRRDYDTFRGLWAKDAVWTISEPLSMYVHGIDSIVAKLQELLAREQGFFRRCTRGRFGLMETAHLLVGV